MSKVRHHPGLAETSDDFAVSRLIRQDVASMKIARPLCLRAEEVATTARTARGKGHSPFLTSGRLTYGHEARNSVRKPRRK